MSELSIKLKGNESFNIREGWLCKGIDAIRHDATIFSQPTAMDTLGVGSKMVKSIRFWMQATGLTEEVRGATGKRQQILTPDFGAIITANDPYFEDIATLWFLHARIVAQKELCTAWHLFFNAFEAVDFTKDDLVNRMSHEMDMLVGQDHYSYKSLADDCSSILRMYMIEDPKDRDPEENLGSPFADLGLIQVGEQARWSYKKAQPIPERLDKLVVMYVLLGALKPGRNAISVDELLSIPCSVGKILNMGRSMLYEYLDLLRYAKLITLNRTAGLDMIYVHENMTQEDILEKYYL